MLPQPRGLSGPPEGEHGFDKGKGRQRATMACVNCRKRQVNRTLFEPFAQSH